jgi:hypothetical protein
MMDLGKLKGVIMNDRVFVISVLIGVCTLIGSVTFYKYNQLQAMKSNIESAIVKGIDPVAVRCAYADQADVVCVAYGAGLQSPNPPRK